MPKATPRSQSSTRGQKSVQPSQSAQKNGQENEGEGNKTAARRYGRAVEKTVRSGVVAEKARAAVRALEGPEGNVLRRAEALAKRGRTASGKTASEQRK